VDKVKKVETEADAANRDPITGEAGAHPVGVGVGSAGGAAVGAAVGSLAGPLGTAVGAAVGGVAGALAGKGVAEAANPTVEDEYWRTNYVGQPYVQTGASYSRYQPAYRAGWEGRGKYGDLSWSEAEKRMAEDWRDAGSHPMDWDEARPAARDAWERAGRP
jgi:hypothetical protein